MYFYLHKVPLYNINGFLCKWIINQFVYSTTYFTSTMDFAFISKDYYWYNPYKENVNLVL